MLNVLPSSSWMEHRAPERPFKAYPMTSHSSSFTAASMQPPADALNMAAQMAMHYQQQPSLSHQQQEPVSMVTKSEPSSPTPRHSSLQLSNFIDIANEGRSRSNQPASATVGSSTLDYSTGGHGVVSRPTTASPTSSTPSGGAPLNYDRRNSSPEATLSSGSSVATTTANNSDLMDSQFGLPPKKRLHSVPDDLKDQTYWDKRKKNNESAKRSRDQRRMKEEQIAMRVVYLEQENLQLRTEVSLLKSEIEKLRCMLYNS